MNNILKRMVSSVLAFTVALSSVQLYGTTAHAAVASGVKGDANADGVVTEADLAIYESYFLNNDDIADDIIEDMDISYMGEAGLYAYISLNDYLAVKKYLAGETASVEAYDAYAYINSYSSERVFFSGYKHGIDVSLTVDDESCTEYEMVWNEQPDSVLSLSDDGTLATNAVESDIGKTYKAIAIGKKDGNYAGAYVVDVTFRKAAFDVSTDDGEFTYGKEILITQPGTYNITSTDSASQAEAVETICISEDIGSGKVILNLNGMNINYGDAYYPGNFINGMAEQCDVDIMLSGSNVIRNAGVSLFTQGQVNIYGTDEDTLSLLGNSFLGADYLTINGGDITVKGNSYCALSAYQLTMLGGSLDASFSPVEGATDNTSNTSLTGIGMECGNVIYRKGNLSLSGNEGALSADSIEGFYVSPLFSDIDVSVSDDGATYTAIEGSPFSDPVNSPSAYTDAVGSGAPDNSVDISNYVENKNFIKIIMVATYSYKVTIDAGEHSSVQYEDDTASQKTFWVSGGEKLPSGITFTANEGWEIDGVTASINGGSAVNVTDISEIVINGDTVINVTAEDVKAPVISGITNGSNYCETITFTVTDDSDVTVVIEGEATQPDENGIYTIVGKDSACSIIATDEFGNETIYTITVYKTHLSLLDHRDNGDGTHTGVCVYCEENVIENHNFNNGWHYFDIGRHKITCIHCQHTEYRDHDFTYTDNGGGTHAVSCDICGYEVYKAHDMAGWVNETDTVHRNDCLYCDYYETAEHAMSDGTDNGDGTHKLECLFGCGYITDEGHNYGEWENNYETGKHERTCTVCRCIEEAEHVFGEWTDSPETGYCKRECETCRHIEEADHDFSVWTENAATGEHERICSKCKRTEFEAHIMGEWMFGSEEEHFRQCNICNYKEEAEHEFGEWVANPDTGKCERECEDCGYVEEKAHNYLDMWDYEDVDIHSKMCVMCGNKIYADHSVTEWNEEDGFTHSRICQDHCGYRDVAPHNFGEWVKNQESGKYEKECADCGHTEEAEHVFGDWTDNAETGKHERTCSICGETEEEEHKMLEWTADGGEHTRECTVCGRQEAENHSAEYKDYDEYFHERLCTVCGDVSYGEHVKDAKYEGNEKHCILCIVCGYSEKVESCKGVWQTVKEATCTEEGTEEMICDVCGEKHTRSIEMLPHEFVNGRCSSCYLVDPTIGDSSTNPPTGVTLGTGLATLIPASALVFFARPKTKKRSK